MAIEDLLKAGIAAVQAGDRERAAGLFAQVVKVDPSSEDGWYWLGLCFSASDRREYCFRRVLALNPNHDKARQQLERLAAPPTPTPAAPAPPFKDESESQPARDRPPQAPDVPKPVAPFDSYVSPFVEGIAEPVQQQAPQPAMTPAFLEAEQPEAPAAPTPKPRPKPRKKGAAVLWWTLGILSVCCVGAGFLLFSSQLAGALPQNLIELLTPVRIPTEVAFVTPTSPPASPTPEPPTPIPSPLPTVSYAAQFEEATCLFDEPSGANVTCGYLIVPEDRAGDPAHTIRLAVAVYHSRGSSPGTPPVLFLQGGPGGAAVQLSGAAFEVLVEPFLGRRDFVTFDQRGTGLSEPALDCDELTKTFLQDIHGLIPGSTRKLVYSNAFLSCNGLMQVQGVNLNAYTTVASAADIKDLVQALGYEKVDLYGASYGTRLALVVMRDYPEIVNSAILDSVVPVETNLFYEYAESVEFTLNTLFERCQSTPDCAAAYPQLGTVFWELVAQLNAQPVTVTTSSFQSGTITETVDGSTFMSILMGSLRTPALIPTAPQTIYRFRNGDYSTLIAAQASLPFTFEGISPGLYISMMCNEHILATTLEELQTLGGARQDIKDYAWLPFYGTAEDLFKTCQSWGATGPRLGENDPTLSAIPSLIITGKYDPATPPIYGQQIAGRLSQSYYFEFPNQGHVPTATDVTGCAMDIALEFLNDPSVEPDRGCLEELEDVEFLVPYTGTPALPLRTVSAAGISVRVPRDWETSFFSDGTYWRGNSPLDITQLGIFQEQVSVEEMQDWLSLKAYGYGGLDGAPVGAGQRSANGLTWNLYTSTSDGRPVDLALASYGGRALVALMFCNSDEHDALYQTVFLPLLDSAQP